MLGCVCMGVGEIAVACVAAGSGAGVGAGLWAVRAKIAAWWNGLFTHKDGGDAQLGAATRRAAVVATVLVAVYTVAALGGELVGHGYGHSHAGH